MVISEWVLVPRKRSVYTISSLHYQALAKSQLLRIRLGSKKGLLHADASTAVVDSYWPVTRTDVGGHFCASAMVVLHANKCAPKAFALLSE